MDPSHSIPSDPHHPPEFTPFLPFPTSNNTFASGPISSQNHPLFSGPPVNQNPYNNHVLQPQPPQAASLPPNPSLQHAPYSEMICAAIAALNEPFGSSKMAISRYIEKFNPGLPTAHAALLTHHLKTLKNSGVLAMVKKSYKFAASSPPESVAVAAAAAAAGLEAPRSETFPSNNNVNEQRPLDPASGSSSQPQKRGRGRPPKPKPEVQQPSDVQPNTVQSNGLPRWELFELPVTKPTEEFQGTESAKRRPGRPRKNGAPSIVQAAVMAGIMKRRGRPPGRRAAGRQRKPKSVSATASVFPFVVNGVRRRGRPRRVDSSGTTVAPAGGEVVAVAPGMKRGRGRPPKIGGVMNRLITKPKRGRGRPVGRPRKNPTWPITGASGTQGPAYGELKRKFDLFQEKAKEILHALKAGVTSDNQAVMQAIQDLEGLIEIETVGTVGTVETVETVEPQAMEEVQPEEAAPQTEAQTDPETQGDEEGQEREAHTQNQTEAEAMQEALF